MGILSRCSLPLGFFLLTFSAIAQPAATPSTNFWIPNGAVYATESKDGVLFIGGRFDQVGPVTGGFAPISATNGSLVPPFPAVEGTVRTAISDGAGGFFIGGSFSRVGAVSTTNLVHLTDPTAVGSGTFSMNGQVLALALHNGQIYFGGEFTTVNGESRTYLACADAVTGTLLPWSMPLDGAVRSLAVTNNILYVGGSFQNIDGATRPYLAAVDLSSNQVQAWSPAPNSRFGQGVNQLTLADGRLYVVGDFTQIASATRGEIAAFDLSNHSLLGWDPQASVPYTTRLVQGIAVGMDAVYIYGGFLTLGAQSRSMLGAVDKNTAVATAWNPHISSDRVYAMALGSNTVYIGGDFLTVATNGPTRLAALDMVTGNPKAWVPAPGGAVHSLLVQDDLVFVGGEFNSIGGVARKLVAAIDLSTGAALPWDAQVSALAIQGDTIYSLALRGDALYLGGRYHRLSGQLRNYLGAVSATTGAVLPFNPNYGGSSFIENLTVAGTNLILNSSTIYNTETGASANWNLGVSGSVSAYCVKDDTLFVGGNFGSVQGHSRSNLAAFNITSRQLLPWNPSVNGAVSKLVLRDQSILALGTFTRANGLPRANIAAFDTATKNLVFGPTNLTQNATIQEAAVSHDALYIAGNFSQVNGANHSYFSGVDLISGVPFWTTEAMEGLPNNTLAGWTIRNTGDYLAIGGTFNKLGGKLRTGLAMYPFTNSSSSLQFLSPTNFTTVQVPTASTLPIQFSASASVESVSVYANDAFLFTLPSPFQTNWTVPKYIGDYLLSAVGHTGDGDSSVAPSVRVSVIPPDDYVPPTISISSPITNGVYSFYSNFVVQTVVNSAASEVETAEFFFGTNLVHVDVAAPFQFSTNLPYGTNSVTVRLTDEFGVQASAGPVPFRINRPPQVTLLAPQNGSFGFAPTNVFIQIQATDSDGSIARTEFFNGSELINVFTNPISYIYWSNAPAGIHHFRVVVTDNFGDSTSSAIARVTLLEAPSISLTIDNGHATNVTFLGSWSTFNLTTDWLTDHRRAVTDVEATASATYRPNIPTNDFYDISFYYPLGNWATNSPWLIAHEGGVTPITVNQRTNGGKWVVVAGSIPFAVGTNGFVQLSNNTGATNDVVVADAIRFSTSVAPFVTNQPQAKILDAGATLDLNVGVYGSPPLSYQWFRNGTALSGATGSALKLDRVSYGEAGEYSVSISNVRKTVLSSNAVVSVLAPAIPVFTSSTITGSNTLQTIVHGIEGSSVTLQDSTNLIHWATVTNIMLPDGAVTIEIPLGENGQRFIRAVRNE